MCFRTAGPNGSVSDIRQMVASGTRPESLPIQTWEPGAPGSTLSTMAQNAVKGALMTCTMGQGPPAQLTPIPAGPPVQIDGNLAGTVMDFKPMANIPTFGMCISMSNPQVAAATAAALGVLTPQPCIPVTSTPC